MDLSTLPIKSDNVPLQYPSLSKYRALSAIRNTVLTALPQSLCTPPPHRRCPWKTASGLARTWSRSSGARRRQPKHQATRKSGIYLRQLGLMLYGDHIPMCIFSILAICTAYMGVPVTPPVYSSTDGFRCFCQLRRAWNSKRPFASRRLVSVSLCLLPALRHESIRPSAHLELGAPSSSRSTKPPRTIRRLSHLRRPVHHGAPATPTIADDCDQARYVRLLRSAEGMADGTHTYVRVQGRRRSCMRRHINRSCRRSRRSSRPS